MRACNMKKILFFVFAFFLVGVLTIPESSAQDAIPSWIKNNAGWWADDKISDSDFLSGIKFLVETNIIQFQSDVDYKKSRNIEKHLLDWDTVVNDSMYAYTGSIKLQKKFFDSLRERQS